MKNIILGLFSFFAITTGFADDFILDNQLSYKVGIQWASSLKEVEEGNQAIMSKGKLDPATYQMITTKGKVSLTIPPQAEYFRILAWSKEEQNPDLLTNWVDVVPNKTFTLTPDRLVPAVLMSGMGC